MNNVSSRSPHRPDLRIEKRLLRSGYRSLAALDEVGRGALAGPVTVGAVVITGAIGRIPPGLRDSKLLTAASRDALVGPIRRWVTHCATGHASPAEIDMHGIMTALRLAAGRALAGLGIPVDAALLDGDVDYLSAPAQQALYEVGPPDPVGGGAPGGHSVIPGASLPVHLQVKGDLRCASVAAASVLAKTTRDALMAEYDGRYPCYGWSANKGYGTAAHRAAIVARGPCDLHRKSWRLS